MKFLIKIVWLSLLMLFSCKKKHEKIIIDISYSSVWDNKASYSILINEKGEIFMIKADMQDNCYVGHLKENEMDSVFHHAKSLTLKYHPVEDFTQRIHDASSYYAKITIGNKKFDYEFNKIKKHEEFDLLIKKVHHITKNTVFKLKDTIINFQSKLKIDTIDIDDYTNIVIDSLK